MTVVSRQAGAAAAGAPPMEEVGLPSSCTAASLPGSLGPVCGPDPLSGPVSVGSAYLPALSTYASFSTSQMTHGGRQEDNYAVSDLTIMPSHANQGAITSGDFSTTEVHQKTGHKLCNVSFTDAQVTAKDSFFPLGKGSLLAGLAGWWCRVPMSQRFLGPTTQHPTPSRTLHPGPSSWNL